MAKVQGSDACVLDHGGIRMRNYPIKIYMNNPQDKATILYTNFSEEKLEDSLFLLPEEYQKFSM